MSTATVLALIDALIAMLPKLVQAGIEIADLVKQIEAVWSEVQVSPDDPRWVAARAAIDEGKAKLKARAEELNDNG